MPAPKTEAEAEMAAEAIITMMRDPKASREYLGLLNGKSKFTRLMLAASLQRWQETELTFPVRLRRMVPDALDLATGTFARVVREVHGELVEERVELETPYRLEDDR